MRSFIPGGLYRFQNYTFEDNNEQRDKYCIILAIDGDKALLIHSLTTTKNKHNVPRVHYGCNVHVQRDIPYYFIPSGQVIGDQQYFFDEDTFIFFMNNVRAEPVSKFEKAATTLFGVVYLGTLLPEELNRLIKCALKSKHLPSNIVKLLIEQKSDI